MQLKRPGWLMTGTVFLRVVNIALIGVVLVVWLALGLIIFGISTQRFQVISVLSGSMEPAIPRGSLIVNVPIKTSEVVVGDVITFHLPTKPSALETHRVKSISIADSERILETKGDANSSSDPWGLKLLSEPAWKVAAVVPALGLLFGWIRGSVFSVIALLAIPALLIIIWLYKIWRPTNKKIFHM